MAGAAVELEQSILKPETFTEKATEIIKTQIPLQNQALCGWIFTHVRNLIEHYEHNKLTGNNNQHSLHQTVTLKNFSKNVVFSSMCNFF